MLVCPCQNSPVLYYPSPNRYTFKLPAIRIGSAPAEALAPQAAAKAWIDNLRGKFHACHMRPPFVPFVTCLLQSQWLHNGLLPSTNHCATRHRCLAIQGKKCKSTSHQREPKGSMLGWCYGMFLTALYNLIYDICDLSSALGLIRHSSLYLVQWLYETYLSWTGQWDNISCAEYFIFHGNPSIRNKFLCTSTIVWLSFLFVTSLDGVLHFESMIFYICFGMV